MSELNEHALAYLQRLLDEVFAEFYGAAQAGADLRRFILTKAAEDPYLQSRLERILDLSQSS